MIGTLSKMSQINNLRSAGLLNEASDYDDLTSETKKSYRVGFCTSLTCHGNRVTGGTPKFLAIGNECPDCGHSLKWKMLTFDQYETLKARKYVRR
jgi:hypothetical protein